LIFTLALPAPLNALLPYGLAFIFARLVPLINVRAEKRAWPTNCTVDVVFICNTDLNKPSPKKLTSALPLIKNSGNSGISNTALLLPAAVQTLGLDRPLTKLG